MFQLMDVLVWFRIYVDAKPKTENWEVLEPNVAEGDDQTYTAGKVINYNIQKKFAFFEPNDNGENIFIPPHLVLENALVNGTKIQVKIETYADTRTDGTKVRVKTVEVI